MNSKYLSEKTVADTLAADRELTNEISGEGNVRSATTSYQAEFPYERDEEAQVTRREFCNFLFLTSGALFLGSAAFAGNSIYESRNAKQYAPAKIEGAEALARIRVPSCATRSRLSRPCCIKVARTSVMSLSSASP